MIKVDGKQRHLGTFDTPELAEELYNLVKVEYVSSKAEQYKAQLHPQVYVNLVTI